MTSISDVDAHHIENTLHDFSESREDVDPGRLVTDLRIALYLREVSRALVRHLSKWCHPASPRSRYKGSVQEARAACEAIFGAVMMGRMERPNGAATAGEPQIWEDFCRALTERRP